MFLFIFSLPLLESSNWNLPSFLFVSHGRIAWTCAYSLPFRSHALSFTIAWIRLPRCNYCHACLLTTHLIALAGRPATVSARSLNCSTLGKFGSEFGRWPTIVIHSDTRVLIDSHCKHTPIQDYQSFSLCQAGLENWICETTMKKTCVVSGDRRSPAIFHTASDKKVDDGLKMMLRTHSSVSTHSDQKLLKLYKSTLQCAIQNVKYPKQLSSWESRIYLQKNIGC